MLQDLDKATMLRDEVQTLSNRRTALKRSIDLLERKRTRIAKKLASEMNRLDRLKAEAVVSQKVTSVIEDALRRGYTSYQLTSVFVWPERMEIQGQPGASIERLLEFFASAKNLANLKTQETVVEKRLQGLRRIEADTKARIDLLNSQYLKNLKQQSSKGKVAIETVATKVAEEFRRIIAELVEHTRIAESASAKNLREREELDRLRRSLEPVAILLENEPSSTLAETVAPPVAIHVLENLVSWFERKYPNAVTQAAYNNLTNEFTLNPYVNTMRAVAFLKFASELIKKLAANESKVQ